MSPEFLSEFGIRDPKLNDAKPDEWLVGQIRRKLADATVRVQPLPSNIILILIGGVVFGALAIAMAMPLGLYGLHEMSARQRGMEFSVIGVLALVMAGIVAEQMVPGSRRILSPAKGAVLALLVLSFTAQTALPGFTRLDFVKSGLPCLEMGTACALAVGVAVRLIMQRGFVAHPIPAAVAAGAFAGLTAVATLTLHCPILNAQHVIVWHGGVLLIAAVAGGFGAWCLSLNVALWIVQILLAALFGFAGSAKFTLPMAPMAQQTHLAPWFLYLIGVAEITGAVGLLLPRMLRRNQELTPIAALGLFLIMIGAVTIMLAISSPDQALIPAVTGAACAFVVWGRWNDVTKRFWPTRAV